MNQHRPTRSPAPGPRPEGHRTEHDDLTERVAAALRSREPDAAGTAAVAARIAARVTAAADGRSDVVTPFVRRASRIAVTGVVTSSIVVAGATAAAAANPYTSFAATVDGVVQAVGVDWSSMPDGYTREQYDAFWGAGFTSTDTAALEELWSLDATETKSRAGQMVLDGEQLPFEPGTHAEPAPPEDHDEAILALFEAGYTTEDIKALSALWETGHMETKIRAGEMILDGRTPPLP